ncbi:Nudix hydrolase domain-containing protein [Favolaschia claudopus]|uniref:Nudix hydrolase domain-containing protein n=1 Tax=Favolaschia claudopus TaxID=2862362 RepID=A0AAW0DWE3_9AGAR
MAHVHKRSTSGTGTSSRPQRVFPAANQRMSEWSTPLVRDSSWADSNFLLGAGMVVIQPGSGKLVVVYESKKKYWFLPKGRKDVGESLEQAALREAYEESGYRVEFLPLFTQTRAPSPPSNPHAAYEPNTEPIYITTVAFPARHRANRVSPAGEYLTFWYVGQIPEDAVREENTGMPDEVNFVTHLVDVNEALKLLCAEEALIVHYAWKLFCCTNVELEKRSREQPVEDAASTPSAAA